MICFGRWDVHRWGANRRLKLARPLALALHASAFDVRRPCVDQPAASRTRVGSTWSTGRLADVPQPGTHVRDRTRPDCGTDVHLCMPLSFVVVRQPFCSHSDLIQHFSRTQKLTRTSYPGGMVENSSTLGETCLLVPVADVTNSSQNVFLLSPNLASFCMGASLQILSTSLSYCSRDCGDELHAGFSQPHVVKANSISPQIRRMRPSFPPRAVAGTTTGHPREPTWHPWVHSPEVNAPGGS